MNRTTQEGAGKTAYEAFTFDMYVEPWERLQDHQKERWRKVAAAVGADLNLTYGWQRPATVTPISTSQRLAG